MSGMMSIGITGLNAASVNLATVSHNITNADTEGYSRQRAVQASNTAVSTGSGFIGQGTHVTTVERLYSSYLIDSRNSAQTTASALDSYYTEISKIDNMLSEENAGLATAIDSFFTGVNDAATNPSESSSRQSMISSAQALVARYQALDGQLDTLYRSVNTQITSTVDSINTYATQIASLNQQIVKAQASNNQPANDLLDKRDQLVAELNTLVGVTTTTDSNGSYNVFFGTGQQLVVGTQVTELKADKASSDVSRLTIYTVATGGNTELPESLITGGALGGLLDFRSETLDKTSNELGANATALALTFNAQFALGQDANGLVDSAEDNSGFESDFFTLSSTVEAITKVKAIANRNNLVSTEVTITLSEPTYDDGEFTTYLTGSDYTLNYDGSNYTLRRVSDNETWSAASIADLNDLLEADPQGFLIDDETTLTLNTGDSYTIEPTRGAAGKIGVNTVIAADTDLLALAAPIRTSVGDGNTGTATISDGSVTAEYKGYVLDDDPNTPLVLTYDSSTSPASITWAAVTTRDLTTDPEGTSTIAAGSVSYEPGSTISINGYNIVISGTPANGDTFEIERNMSASNDSRNALALVGLQTAKTMAGGSDTYETNYASLVSYVGNKTNQVSVTLDAQESLVTQASDAVAALSGVNLSEEAADLIKYQEAYQAAAKVISIASELFDTILAIKS